jgi:hypothetical protein
LPLPGLTDPDHADRLSAGQKGTMHKFLVHCLIALFALCCAASAMAERTFPQNAKRGEMKAFQYPYMKIGDKTLHLSAGSRIYNEQNFIIMPASLQKQAAQIMFATDIGGELSEVWLLTAEEARKYPLRSAAAAGSRLNK